MRIVGDVRLALGAAVAWLALTVCLQQPFQVSLVVGVTGALVGVAALTVPLARWRHAAQVAGAVAAGGFCLALVLLPFAARGWQARASPLTELARRNADVTLVATTTADPRSLAATGVAGSPRVAVLAEADEVTGEGRRFAVGGQVLVLAPAAPWTDVLPGQQFRLDGNLQPSLDGEAAGVTLFARQAPQLLGHPPWWQRGAGAVRSSLRSAASVLPPDERGLLPGLVDGDTTGLDPVLIERFRVAGLTHLVAVSGTNCSIVVGCVLLVLRRARVRPAWCAVIGAAVLAAFVVVARPSPSVLRAAVMAAIALVSLAAGRPRQALPALAAATLGLLVYDPLLAVDAGFAMSVLATAALLLIAPGWAGALRRRHVPAGVAEAVAVAAAAHVLTAPVIAAIGGRVSLVAIPANVLVEPVVAVATVLGFGAAVVSPLWSTGGQALAWAAGWPCRWLVWVADRFGGLTGANLPWPGGVLGGLALLAVSLLLVLLLRRAGPWRLLAIAALVGVAVQIPARNLATGWPPPGWVFVACDVGQGDGLVLPAGAHTAVVVDAGPDPVAMDRCLRELGVRDVALLAFSHYHLDHVGGVAGVLHGRTVGQVITGPLAEPFSGVELVQHQLAPRGLAVTTPAPGTTYTVGAVRLQVLAPDRPFRDTRSDPNNSSLVLRATVGDVRILLCGDVEIEAQQAMLDAGLDVTADVLKVPHHGSAYSDPDFLAAVHARVGVISVGLHNDYGHPSPVLLRELARLDVPARRTDHDGDVAVAGPRAQLRTVAHGVAASTAARGVPTARAHSAIGAAASVRSGAGARMGAWPLVPLVPSPSTSCPRRCPRSSCSSATRNCWSVAASARSPPSPAGPTRTSSRPNARARRSTDPSCTSCSGRRCSATPG